MRLLEKLLLDVYPVLLWGRGGNRSGPDRDVELIGGGGIRGLSSGVLGVVSITRKKERISIGKNDERWKDIY